jgi:hypothetical protein
MYLIKEIGFTLSRELCVQDGIRAKLFKPSNCILVCNPFWGMADVDVHDDFSQFPETKGQNEVLFSYTSSVNVKCLGAGYKELSFYVSSHEPDNVQGYIVFVPACWKIETNGQKVAGRTPTEGVFILEEGQHLTLDGTRVNVINGQLVLRK